MTIAEAPREVTFTLDPLIDAPLVGPRVLALVGDESGSSMWRVWQPMATLKLHGYSCDWAPVRDWRMPRVRFDDYDALVLCRLAWGSDRRGGSLRFLRRLRSWGIRIFFECDDDLFTPFTVDQQLGRHQAEKTRLQLEADIAACRWLLERVDGVTVSTQYLASTVRRFTNAPVEVVPNAIDVAWFQEVQRGVPRPIAGPTIGWAGGNRPDSDLAMMAEAWGRIARRHPEVTFIVAGHQPPIIGEHVPEARMVRVPWLPAERYPVGMVGVDIGCCPLDDRPFNRSKTPIKAWEYALSGAAVVASPTVYGRVIDDLVNGYLARTVDDWEECLRILLGRQDKQQDMVRRLRRQVRERWSLRANYWRWPAAWHRLWGAHRPSNG